MKYWNLFAAALCMAMASVSASAQDSAAPTSEEWSPWMHKRGHFEFQVRTERVTPSVMRIRMRIRPDVAAIQREPRYSNEPYYLEYYQGTVPSGWGETDMYKPRRIVFPANAPESCVYEEEEIYSIIEPAGRDDRLYMDHSVSPLPLLSQYGSLVSGFELAVNFGANVGPGNVVRFSGVDRNSFQPVC